MYLVQILLRTGAFLDLSFERESDATDALSSIVASKDVVGLVRMSGDAGREIAFDGAAVIGATKVNFLLEQERLAFTGEMTRIMREAGLNRATHASGAVNGNALS
jgi:hypothetical protein